MEDQALAVIDPSVSTHTISYRITSEHAFTIGASLSLGEALRRAVMGRARSMLGARNIPWTLSGHDVPPRNRHDHAFYLPEDRDRDGRLDHFLVHVGAGVDEVAAAVLDALDYILSAPRQPRIVVERETAANAAPLLQAARVWRSATPYLHPWHLKKKFTVADQLRRECRIRGLPEPVNILPLDSIQRGGKSWRPHQFQRRREKQTTRQPDRRGQFIELHFEQPVAGPLALGYACHYGLGLFEPARID